MFYVLLHLQLLHHRWLQLLGQPLELGFLSPSQLLPFIDFAVVQARLCDRTDLAFVICGTRDVPLTAIELHEMLFILENSLVGEEA